MIDLGSIEPGLLPTTYAVSAVTLGELVASVHATEDPLVRSARQHRIDLPLFTRNGDDVAHLSAASLDVVAV